MSKPLDFVREISRDQSVAVRLKPRIAAAYTHLEIPLENAYQLAEQTIQIASSDKPVTEIEQEIYRLLERYEAFKNFDHKMDVRALMWYQKIAPYIVGESLLDLGGGDGRTAKRVKDEQYLKGKDIEVHVADILDYPDRTRGLPYTQMNGCKTPFEDGQFDTVFLGTVLHHVGRELDDCLELMNESIRIAKKRVVVIESIYQNPQERAYTMWIDWWYNRVLHFDSDPIKKVNVPFNFRQPKDWKKLLRERSLKVQDYNLGTFQILNPEHHWLFVCDKE